MIYAANLHKSYKNNKTEQLVIDQQLILICTVLKGSIVNKKNSDI